MTTTDQPVEKVPVAPIVKVPIPNSQGILILGIFSLVTTFCCASFLFIGLVLGIIAVVLSSKAVETYERNPKAYTHGSIKNVNGGRICGIIGIAVNGIIFMGGIIILIVLGSSIGEFLKSFPWEDYL